MLFEQNYKEELLRITSDKSIVEKYWTEIKTCYSESNRFYHNIHHLNNFIEQLLPIKDQIEDWTTMIFSIAYHDIIYNTLKQDNEEKSAALADERLTEVMYPAAQKEKCRRQILATKQHTANDDTDTNYFTDADLSILGYDKSTYQLYTEQIRKEYKFYPDLLYKPGRKKVLKDFLAMNPIFKTEHFRNKFEAQAKINIAEELRSLS